MKKLLVVAMLAIALLVVACATPTAEPTKAPASSAASPTKAASHPEVKVNIYTSSFGTLNYTFSFALGDMMNKKHPWLRIAVQETTQAADAIKTVAADPALRKNSMFPLASSIHYDATNGTGAFVNNAIKYQAVAMYNSNAVAFVALDSKIQTVKDLDGKRITVGSAGGAAPTFESIIAAYGIKPAKIDKISWEPGKDALIDGKTDACAQTLGDVGLNPYQPNATISQLQATNGFHLVAMDPELVKKAATTVLLSPIDLPSGTLGLSKPTTVALNTNTLAVLPEFDSEAAYEIAKFIVENADGFKDYDKSLGSVKKSSVASFAVPIVTVNPGAEKYYKEAGMKIGQ